MFLHNKLIILILIQIKWNNVLWVIRWFPLFWRHLKATLIDSACKRLLINSSPVVSRTLNDSTVWQLIFFPTSSAETKNKVNVTQHQTEWLVTTGASSQAKHDMNEHRARCNSSFLVQKDFRSVQSSQSGWTCVRLNLIILTVLSSHNCYGSFLEAGESWTQAAADVLCWRI